MQFLTGDLIDNIVGVKGIGPVKANKLLTLAEGDEDQMFSICVEHLCYDRAVENGATPLPTTQRGRDMEPTNEGNIFKYSFFYEHDNGDELHSLQSKKHVPRRRTNRLRVILT